MKVLSNPLTFVTGDVLTPEDLNRVYLYSRDAVADVAERRWAKAILPFAFVTDVATPYTEASGTVLTHRFTCPVTCVVEGGFFHGNLTSTQPVTVNITKVTGGATPTGCTVPWLTTLIAVASAAEDTLDVNVDKFTLEAGAEYSITVASTGTFTLSRFDVFLNLAVDRWTLAGTTSVPDFEPTLFTDASAPNAVTVAANNASLTTEAAKFANALTAPHPVSFVKSGLLSGTDADVRTFTIPRFRTGRATAVIKRVYLYVVMAVTDGVTVTARLKNAAGATLLDVVANVAGVTYISVDSGAQSIALSGAVDSNVTTDDLSIEFINSEAAKNCLRAHAIVWLARA